MIQFDDVTVRKGRKLVLDAVSFRVEQGQKAVFRGKSGAGKSSVLLALAGALTPDAGTLRFNGVPVDATTVQTVRAQLAFVAQEPVLGAETIREALMLPFTFRAHRQTQPAEEDLKQLLATLALDPEILDRESAVVSGGEKQRVAVGRALLPGKHVFLADEVTSALAPESRRILLDIFSRPELTVLSVSHDEEWTRRCDRVFQVHAGAVSELEPETRGA
jgi:putative ABC transport system ATP-binding protein